MLIADNQKPNVLHIGDAALTVNVTWNEAERKGVGPIVNEYQEIWADWAGCNPKGRKQLAKSLKAKTFADPEMTDHHLGTEARSLW